MAKGLLYRFIKSGTILSKKDRNKPVDRVLDNIVRMLPINTTKGSGGGGSLAPSPTSTPPVPTDTPTPTPTSTPVPTDTPTPTPTDTLAPTDTPTPTPTIASYQQTLITSTTAGSIGNQNTACSGASCLTSGDCSVASSSNLWTSANAVSVGDYLYTGSDLATIYNVSGFYVIYSDGVYIAIELLNGRISQFILCSTPTPTPTPTDTPVPTDTPTPTPAETTVTYNVFTSIVDTSKNLNYNFSSALGNTEYFIWSDAEIKAIWDQRNTISSSLGSNTFSITNTNGGRIEVGSTATTSKSQRVWEDSTGLIGDAGDVWLIVFDGYSSVKTVSRLVNLTKDVVADPSIDLDGPATYLPIMTHVKVGGTYVESSEANEGSYIEFTVKAIAINNSPTTTVPLNWSGTADNSGFGEGTDWETSFNSPSSPLTMYSSVATKTLLVREDMLTEGPETITLTLGATDSKGVSTGEQSSTVTINDTSTS